MSYLSSGIISFRNAYEISPIFMVNGIAGKNHVLPIASLTENYNVIGDLLNLLNNTVDNAFAHWQVLPGTQLVKNEVGMYPFANQITAANAIVKQPLAISMVMHCPIQTPGGYLIKLAAITALKNSLDQHVRLGGTFDIATPSFIYTGCILVGVSDVSGGESNQVQTSWQFDFIQPLIVGEATNQLNQLYTSLTNQTPITGQPANSGVQE